MSATPRVWDYRLPLACFLLYGRERTGNVVAATKSDARAAIKRKLHTDSLPKRIALEEVKLPERCPKCGSPTFFGYGLMGGGCGAYVLCDNSSCDYFNKVADKVDR